MSTLEPGQQIPEWRLPLTPTTIVSTAIATRDWQAGPGGNRFAPQALHFWIRSSPALVPSQKNCESRLTMGRTVMGAPWG